MVTWIPPRLFLEITASMIAKITTPAASSIPTVVASGARAIIIDIGKKKIPNHSSNLFVGTYFIA
jgi:hypothetical protein